MIQIIQGSPALPIIQTSPADAVFPLSSRFKREKTISHGTTTELYYKLRLERKRAKISRVTRIFPSLTSIQ